MIRSYLRIHQLLSRTPLLSSCSKPCFITTRGLRITAIKPKSDSQKLWEEEQLPWYKPELFYPVHIGEILNSKYRVVGKLGYGAYSTVWLCRDIQDSKYVAVKVCSRDGFGPPKTNREYKFYEHLMSINSQHIGQAYIRNLLGTFEVNGPTGEHLCLVQSPMHMTIEEFQEMLTPERLDRGILNETLAGLLEALSFLHDEANVIHTDIQPSNIMLTIEDESLLSKFEQEEIDNPSPKKVIDENRSIYSSRKFGLPQDTLWGHPILCDFGEARIGKFHKDMIQPQLYRAPEVLFEMEWSSSVDIWNVAVMIWDLFEGQHLFDARDKNKEPSVYHLSAEMVGYLGDPPVELLRRSEVANAVFDEQGHWNGAKGIEVPDISLEKAETVLEGEEKIKFLNFIRSMLKWVPEERPTAAELLNDPWFSQEDTS